MPEAVQLLHGAGGLAVLAHPAQYHNDELPAQLAPFGLDGLECRHPDQPVELQPRYLQMAARLGLEAVEKLPGGDDVLRVGELPEAEALPDFLRRVKVALGPNGIRFADGGKPIRRVAVGGGACGGYLWAAAANGCDAFVTSDLKYNQFLDAGDLGLTVADAGHFPTEDAVCPMLVQYLKEKFPGVPVEKSASHREAVQYYV